MKVKTIKVESAKKINLGNYETKDYAIAYEIDLAPTDNAEAITQQVKISLDKMLTDWENQIQHVDDLHEQNSLFVTFQGPVSNDASQEQEILPEVVSKVDKSDSYDCPECGEKMIKKDGKNYFICSKHWGYPDMIMKGSVKIRQFQTHPQSATS
jgi:predicted RNA-binding Zn-ribbon protein involved in translation (DUF1610 family)